MLGKGRPLKVKPEMKKELAEVEQQIEEPTERGLPDLPNPSPDVMATAAEISKTDKMQWLERELAKMKSEESLENFSKTAPGRLDALEQAVSENRNAILQLQSKK